VAKLPRAQNPNLPLRILGRVWNEAADMIERALRVYVVPPLELRSGHNGVILSIRQTEKNVPFKITGDTQLGGTYQILIGSMGTNTIDPSPTSATALSLTNSIDFSNTNRTGYLINPVENGLQLRLLPTNGSVVAWGPTVLNATNTATSPIVIQNIPLPLTLSCTNTAAATNVPVYTLYRHGTSTNQALAVSQTPWRQVSLTGISGTNLPTITAATNCNYFLSGTGVVMAGSSETIPNNLCT
jgi:hypothetical protein